MKTNNDVERKSKSFALRSIRLFQYLTKEKREFILSKQVIRSGTSIGANVKEAIYGQSRADFLAKMSIALKEANETDYWLELIYAGGYISLSEYQSIAHDCDDLIRLLTAIVKSTRGTTC